METTTRTKVIDEIRGITAEQVAKKQDAAKLNYPKILEQIKIAARRGESKTTLRESEMNIYDMELLQADGFRVLLIDQPKSPYDELRNAVYPKPKVWEISW